MAGKIKDSSIQEVRERARIDEVVADYVMLRNAGGGSMKGLCPFHDEKSPSFNVTPARQFCHCFGCGKGGDVIWFLQEHDGLGFVEAVERLADRFGVRLEREEGGEREQPGSRGPQRSRLVEVNRVAQEFYAEQLATPAAVEARRFLAERGFDQAAAAHFGLGFAPRDGDAATRHLQGRGFTTDEAVAAGVTAVGRSAYDRFRGRLLWPIRDSSNSTIGFGARRLFDDDRIEAKYLNTPETTLYKKSQVLYGIDLARRDIGRLSQAVIVEGYTDVMACHLAGITTAVATCGTAFGDDHARVLRRFLNDHESARGEVVFTFDGDEAGQKAAERAFAGDQNFASQTYVAVEPSGMDPCDLRLARGDESVRELIARRVPLYRFVLARVVKRFDLERADGRRDALQEAAKLVTSVPDPSRVDAFARELGQMLGIDMDGETGMREVREAVRRAYRRGPQKAPDRAAPQHRTEEKAPPQQAPKRQLPPLRDARFAIERETLKLVVQHPGAVGRTIDDVDADDFTHPTYRTVWELAAAAGGVTAGSADPAWVARLRDATTDEVVARALGELATEPLVGNASPDPAYVNAHVFRLQELTVQRRIADLKSKLQRTNPVDAADDYNRLFGELMVLEQQRRTLRERAIGG